MEVGEEEGNTVERIFVAIRVRPLNEREKARQDVSEWECVSHNSVRLKNNGHAEPRSPTDTYTFDRVFGEKCPTKQVYEQGIKDVSLSVVRGINSSIFAYGQTSSGKTYTMTGITELAVSDIYQYIEKHKEREFVVKFSAMEIYNEAVRDLLNSNATSLRLLDDPEKGTVVEKLTEETLTERSRLQQLISKCAAERTTEETAMNETSSRSHQILRLTVESNPGDFVGTARSGALFASVNFVDLAGSERASQALSAGTRLREGSHINRSLLTLGTVIRKLSKERNGHIPYRDSKLTRILHNSLGGNARTAIICTISPARSQVEQSKNTLFFAACAKQVTTNARVNVVMSDKVLVKQLQKELSRMENELKSLNTIVLKERELQIIQMDKEIKDLTRQRDLFQNLLKSVGKDGVLRVDQDWASEWSGVANDPSPVRCINSGHFDRTTSISSISNEHLFKQSENSEDNFLLDGCPPTFVGPDPCQGWEEMDRRSESRDNCKEIPCIEIKEVETEHKTDINMSIPASEESERNSPVLQFKEVDDKSSSGNGHGDQYALQQKTEDIKRTKDHLVDLSEKYNDTFESKSRCLASMSPQVDKVDQEDSPHSQFGKLEQNVSPPSFNKLDQESTSPLQSDQEDSPHSQFGKLKQNVSPLSFNKLDQESTSPLQSDQEGSPHSQFGKLKQNVSPPSFNKLDQESTSPLQSDQEDSPHSQFSNLEQNVSPPLFNKLDQESTSPLQSDQGELKTVSPPELDDLDQVSFKFQAGVDKEYSLQSDQEPTSPPQSDQESTSPPQSDQEELKTVSPPELDDLEQVSFKSPAGVEKEYSTNLDRFPEKLFEPKLRAKRRKSSLIHKMNASVEDAESVMDSDSEETSSVLNFEPRMNENKQKPVDMDINNLMVPVRMPRDNKNVNRVRGLSFPGVWGDLIPSKFEMQQRDIIKLWDTCNVPLVHRSYFFLLIQGEEGLDVTPNSSLASLTRERKMLSKQVHKKFSRRAKEELYLTWGIDLKTKNRSTQLAWLIWTDTKDLNHVRESAALVGKLVGFINMGEASKKTFGLGFLIGRKSSESLDWKDAMSPL
ncbi:unnamed protein product [Vicia faba]|uniref:Kinesin motor domain-containing protein n=1 Tax=Vicia faba TaxID=3906 RepID=A0AAV0ZVZ7_VICFA|nr:unnamed protein product [Vicia faba]